MWRNISQLWNTFQCLYLLPNKKDDSNVESPMDTGLSALQIISASPAGDLKFLDMRNNSAPYLEVEAHKGYLTTMTVHRHAPVIATGSGKQLIKTFNTSGEQLSMVRYCTLSFLGQRIGPVSALGFHPYKVLLAAGAVGSLVSVYAGESVQGG